jgi:hypothetical protein
MQNNYFNQAQCENNYFKMLANDIILKITWLQFTYENKDGLRSVKKTQLLHLCVFLWGTRTWSDYQRGSKSTSLLYGLVSHQNAYVLDKYPKKNYKIELELSKRMRLDSKKNKENKSRQIGLPFQVGVLL